MKTFWLALLCLVAIAGWVVAGTLAISQIETDAKISRR